VNPKLLILPFAFFQWCAFLRADSLSSIGGFAGGASGPADWIRLYNKPDNFTHPFRVLQIPGRTNSNHCDLRPLFTYHNTAPKKRLVDARNNSWETEELVNPMPAWTFVRGEIAQVHHDGLLCTKFHYDSDANRRYGGDSFALTNYPGFEKLLDGKTIACFAFEIGQFKFRDYRGITRTVPLYDHGIPYDPYALARSNKLARASTTNGPPPTTNFVGAIK
jgi:hypothetical protein